MYKRPPYHSRGNRFGRSNSRGNKRRRYAGKKALDPKLFVKKAVSQNSEEAYISEHKFADFGFSDGLKANIARCGYSAPTPIQDRAIPKILDGRDVIGIANTGTGKTVAFLLPLVEKVLKDNTQGVLIIAPTRELALQIHEELLRFTPTLRISSATCIGGVSMRRQMADLARLPHFVIGTPGRLKDLEKNKAIHFGDYTSIVLDEVDRMLDMGFVHDIRYIISKLPPKRHSLFFSATLPKATLELARSFLTNPVTISVKKQDTADHIDQDIVRIGGRNKVEVLRELLAKDSFSKVLVFGRTKWGIERLAGNLANSGIRVASIHGNKNQNQRQFALTSFKRDKIQVLLATDVASRGLDIDDITHVINYDPPESYEDYIHRIGRTGRANKRGIALTFVA